MTNNEINKGDQLVSIIVCTRRRPVEVEICLKSLFLQKTDFPFDILCVENDAEQTTREVVERLIPVALEHGVTLRYTCQPVQNIGQTRNWGIEHSTGAFLAFIDDDEYAAEDWLQQLMNVQKKTDADVVTGIVYYEFPEGFPVYIQRSRVYGLYAFPNEPEIHEQGGADANTTLYRRALFALRTPAFDPEYGRTGGGDYEFALFLLGHGKKIYKTTLARVYEMQPAKRAKVWFHLERQFREPSNTYRAIRQHCGRMGGIRFLWNRFWESVRTIFRELPGLFVHPRLSGVNIAGRFACIFGLIWAVLGLRKTGYR